MPTTIKIDPVTRIEGHLAIEVTVDTVGGQQQVVDAKSNGTMFRGFEAILRGRDPLDAPHFTQRICGVCPISHGMAASLNLEAAFGVTAPTNGRVIRNLVLGANFIQSHILHFYHLAALDYIDTAGILDIAPFGPRYSVPDMINDPATVTTLVGHYVKALEMRRKAHQMGAILGGKMPGSPVFVAGGATENPTAAQITAFRALLTELRAFIDGTMLPDVLAVAGIFPQYYDIGRGSGNLLAYGVFDLNATGTTKLLRRGRYTNGQSLAVNTAEITEYVKYSKYSSASNLNPAAGATTPNATKANAYSWIKSPRYLNLVHEVGPLARMYVNGDYTRGISALDRIAARAYEAKKVADAMDGWLGQIAVGTSAYTYAATPSSATGIGLTEAPRGALGHWMTITNSVIDRYQIITPTNWNASPKDDLEQRGPIEQALMGAPIANVKQPIEVLRIVHSFDPCLSCAVHMVRPGKTEPEMVVLSRPSI